MTDFTDRAILAYECGYNEQDLRAHLDHALMAGTSGLSFDHAQVVLSICLVRSLWLASS